VAGFAGAERLGDDLAGLLGAAWAEAPAAAGETRRIAAGEVVVREGEPGDAAWFVIEGLLQVVRAGEVVDRIGPGECFGERSLLLQAPRNATIVAQTPVLAQRVAAPAFLAWSAGQPRLRDLLATRASAWSVQQVAEAFKGAPEDDVAETMATLVMAGQAVAFQTPDGTRWQRAG